jgi:hypothetical protein
MLGPGPVQSITRHRAMSYPPTTFSGVGALGFALTQLIYQLPMLVVLVIGFALIPGRRARIGARRANLATAGLLVLALEMLIGIMWSSLGTLLIMDRNISMSNFRVLAPTISFFLAVLTATAVALLLAAVVAPGPDAAAAVPAGGHDPVAGYRQAPADARPPTDPPTP